MDQPIGSANIFRGTPSPTQGRYLWDMGNYDHNYVSVPVSINNCEFRIIFHFIDYYNANGSDIFMNITSINKHAWKDVSPWIIINGKINILNKTIYIKNWSKVISDQVDNTPQIKQNYFTALHAFTDHVLCVVRGEFPLSISINCQLEIHALNLNKHKDILYHPNSATQIVKTK